MAKTLWYNMYMTPYDTPFAGLSFNTREHAIAASDRVREFDDRTLYRIKVTMKEPA